MKNFWLKLKKPITILAPMDDVTDVVFREVVANISRPDVFFTEFTNVEALNSKGKDSQIRRLEYTKNQHPIVGQIWGLNPDNFYKTAKLLKKLNFDGIDINMGCPEKSVIKNGTCAALIKNRELAKKIIEATIKGANGLPISVKTRIGINEIVTEDWIDFLLSFNLAAIIIHARTVKEKSNVPAHWEEIGKAVKLRDKLNFNTLIIGNGDVKDFQEILEKQKTYKVDGVMIGTGIFSNLWAFAKSEKSPKVSLKMMLKLLLMHAKLFDKTWGESKNFAILRKFFKIYVSNFPNSKELRIKLMGSKNLIEVEKIVSPRSCII